MPGKDSYGPAGKWVHDRAHRIMEESPQTTKSQAYAIATQQGHKVNKTPKDFRTPSGVAEAKEKYDEPKSEYQKTAGHISREEIVRFFKRNPSPDDDKIHELAERKGVNPHMLESQIYDLLGDKLNKEAMISGFFDELEAIEKEAGWGRNLMLAGGLASALGSGVKAAPKAMGALKAAKPAITQTVKAPSTFGRFAPMGGQQAGINEALRGLR